MRGQTLEPISDGTRTETVVEFFLEREAAKAMIGEVREDEPALAEELRVEAIEFGSARKALR